MMDVKMHSVLKNAFILAYIYVYMAEFGCIYTLEDYTHVLK